MAGMSGKIKINSTSKIKKIIVIKKKRIEKGKRAEYLGVNPHSKGLAFSRSLEDLKDNLRPKNKSKRVNLLIITNLTTKKITN